MNADKNNSLDLVRFYLRLSAFIGGKVLVLEC